MTRILIACIGFLFAYPAFAVYKCDVNGKITYGDAPCQSGKASELQLKNTTANSAEAAMAEKQLQKDKKELKRIEQARAKQEAQDTKQNQQLAKTQAAKKKHCDALARKKKWHEEDAATSKDKTREAHLKSARRLGEQMESECGK